MLKKDLCEKTAVLFIKKGLVVQKTKDVQFFLNYRLGGFKNTRTFVLKEKERFFDTLCLLQ